MLLRKGRERREDLTYRGNVTLQLAVADVRDTIVKVQIADDPIVVLELLHIVQPGGEEQSEAASSLDVLLDVDPAVGTAVGCFEDVIADFEIAAQLLSARILLRERVLRFQLVLEVVINLSERVGQLCLDRRLFGNAYCAQAFGMQQVAKLNQEALLDVKASQRTVDKDEVPLTAVGSLRDFIHAGPLQHLLSEREQRAY